MIETGLEHYFGSKGARGTLAQIANRIPPHDQRVSPFLGDCAVMRLLRPAGHNVGFEMDCEVVRAWKNATWNDSRFDIRNDDFFTSSYARSLAMSAETFWFIDPPYLPETRGAKRYRYDMTREQHEQLLELVQEIEGMVMLCGYPSDLYDRELSDWQRHEFTVTTRGGLRTEVLWMNYYLADTLHDYSFLGDNRRQREVIKRRRETIIGKIGRLPAMERLAILQAIYDDYQDEIRLLDRPLF